MKHRFFLVLILSSFLSHAQFFKDKPHIKPQKGFFTYYYDDAEGKVFLEIKNLEKEFIYVHSLKSGIGSNDIGLDRGQLGGTSIVKFKKAGNTLILIEPNQNYRAITNNEAERQSIEQAFAQSVLFGFPIKETHKGSYLVDFTPFLMEDAHQVALKLKKNKEGTYKIDKSRSVVLMENTKAFPKNNEFEALLTFKGEPTGSKLRTVAPQAGVVSVIQHHSLVELPEAGYKPRVFDPRSGAIFTSYMDYATPVYEPIKKRIIIRHRLAKKNPEATVSEALEPIVYYLDPGTPEPIRSALLEGASWWDQAFTNIGYKQAFQVKMLPEDADPMDLRYNVIQWVHRSTRGWSYGASVVDPRTGEILKGHVSLGSLRIRQDFMIAQALMQKPFAKSDSNHQAMLDMALARIRQLSAHEVGHTLGFAHNFAASTTDRASVMDYPHPTLKLSEERIDFDNAYATGIGDWDKVTVAYSYGDIPKNQTEKNYLNQVLQKAESQGLRFITDRDARSTSGAHPDAHLWDNGKDATKELNDVLALRKKAIANFSIDNIKTGEPYSVLEDVFVPLYFYHRYQTEAVSKIIGGLRYTYAVKGDTHQQPLQVLDKPTQMQALEAVVQTLKASTLAIPKDKLSLFPPRAFGYNRTRESFKGNTGVTFDPLGAASTASNMTLSILLNPERMNRLVVNAATQENTLKLDDMLNYVVSQTVDINNKDSYLNEVQTTINYEVIKHLKNLYISSKSIPQVKAITLNLLEDIATSSKNSFIARDITNFLEDPTKFEPLKAPKIPDGSPIGTDACLNTEF